MENFFVYLFTFIVGIYGQLYTNIFQKPNTPNTAESNALTQNESQFLKLPSEVFDSILLQLLIESDQNNQLIPKNIVNLSLCKKQIYYNILQIASHKPFEDSFKLIIDNQQRLKNCINSYNPKRNIDFPPLVASICFKSENENRLSLKPGHIKTLGLLYTHATSLIFADIEILISDKEFDKFEQSFQKLYNEANQFFEEPYNIRDICISPFPQCKSLTESLSTFSKLEKFHANGIVTLGSCTYGNDYLLGIAIKRAVIGSSETENCIPQQLFNEFRKSYPLPSEFCQLQELRFCFNSNDNFNRFQIMRFLLEFPELRVLALRNAGLTLENIEGLEKVLLQISRTLQELDLSENSKLTNKYVQEIFSAPEFPSLQVLNLSKTGINQEELKTLPDFNQKFRSSLKIIHE